MITGKESALAALLEPSIDSEIRTAIAAKCGVAPIAPNCIDGLAAGIAKGVANVLINFLTSNIVVNSTAVPALGIVDSVSGPCTGAAASAPGTIT